jgi:hypothetical protein
MRKLWFVLACFLLLASCVQSPSIEGEHLELESQRLNKRSPLGTNLSGVSPFINDYPFIDAFKNSWEWQTYEGQPAIAPSQLDANGWLKSLQAGQNAYTLIFNVTDGTYPAGDYILLYDGAGSLTIGGDATRKGNATRTGNTTRQVLSITPKKDNPATPASEDVGIFIAVDSTNPNNYIRNMRLIMPGGTCANNIFRYATGPSGCSGSSGSYVPFEDIYATRTFHPRFLRSLANYSTIRFMTWQETNGSIQRNWSDRPKVSDARWSTKKGVPLEVMIDLANTLDVDAWFNMPHAATNSYVTEFAKVTKARLEPGRKVYLEYSNEVWLDRGNNPDDAQFDYAIAQGKRLGLVTSSECSQLGAPRCNALNGNRFQVKRSLEVFALWQQNFGTSNLVRVMASTTLTPPYVPGATSPTRELLRYQNAYTKIDALGIAPYFGDLIYDQNIANEIKPLSVTQYLERLNGVLLESKRQEIRDQRTTLASFSSRIPLIAYEGGQILVQEAVFDPQIERLYDAVNRDPRMKQTYLNYLNMWKAEGGQLYNHFVSSGNWSSFGRWGALEYLTQPRNEAPKFDGLQTFTEQNPKWW